jgi:hypothetical protein
MVQLKEAMASHADKFKQYQALLDGLGKQQINHLIISGEPGVGKSWEAENILGGYARSKRVRVCKSSGHMTPLALYNHLHRYRHPTDINMFDDCDSVFKTPHTMNILKAATDTKTERYITWESTSNKVVATSYQFEGSVLLLTNIDMQANGRLATYQAFLDRVHYFRLDLSPEEKVARIITVLFKKPGKRPIHLDEVSHWLLQNYTRFGKFLSIRTAVKLIELAGMSRDWQDMAETTMIPNNGDATNSQEF